MGPVWPYRVCFSWRWALDRSLGPEYWIFHTHTTWDAEKFESDTLVPNYFDFVLPWTLLQLEECCYQRQHCIKYDLHEDPQTLMWPAIRKRVNVCNSYNTNSIKDACVCFRCEAESYCLAAICNFLLFDRQQNLISVAKSAYFVSLHCCNAGTVVRKSPHKVAIVIWRKE